VAKYFLSLLGGAVGLVAGFITGAFVGAGIAAATHMSTFEGAAGYFAVFFCGPIGAIIGLVLGVWIAARLRGARLGIGGVAGHSAGTFAALFVLAAGVVALMLAFDSTLNRNSAPKQALFEIRLPPGARLDPDRRGIAVELNTERNSPAAFLRDDWRTDGDRPVITGGVDLYFRASSRIIVLKMTGQSDRLFRLNLAANPSHSDSFGPWQPIDWVAERNDPAPRKATAADQFEIRYRVRDPNVEYGRPVIGFELDLPASVPLPQDAKVIKVTTEEFENDMNGAIDPDLVKKNGDRVTMSGTVQLAGEIHSMLVIAPPNQPALLFEIKVPAYSWITETARYAFASLRGDGPPQAQFGPWQNVSAVRDAGQKEPRPPKPGEDAKLRYALK
jgi:hypothetical protein